MSLIRNSFITLFIGALLLLPAMVIADSHIEASGTLYVPISPLSLTPEPINTGDPDAYIGTLFTIFISICVILATIRLMTCGLQYMTSEAVGNKAAAKGCITSVIGGLLLVLTSYIILNTINTDFTSTGFGTFRNTIVNSVPDSADNLYGEPVTEGGVDRNGDGYYSNIDWSADTSGDGWCFIENVNLTEVVCAPDASWNPNAGWSQGECTAEEKKFEEANRYYILEIARNPIEEPCRDTAGLINSDLGLGTFCYDWRKGENKMTQRCSSFGGSTGALECANHRNVTLLNSIMTVTQCYKPYQ